MHKVEQVDPSRARLQCTRNSDRTLVVLSKNTRSQTRGGVVSKFNDFIFALELGDGDERANHLNRRKILKVPHQICELVHDFGAVDRAKCRVLLRAEDLASDADGFVNIFSVAFLDLNNLFAGRGVFRSECLASFCFDPFAVDEEAGGEGDVATVNLEICGSLGC